MFSFLTLISTSTSLFSAESYITSYVKGEEKGPNKFILEAIAKRLETTLGIQLSYRGATFSRNLLLMKQGASDLWGLIKKHPERTDYLYYIEPPVINLNVTFIVRKGEHATIQEYNDLYGLRIGTFRGAKLFPRFTRDKKLNTSYVISLQDGMNKLLAHHIDALIVSEHLAPYQVWRLGLEDKVAFSDYAYRETNPLHIVLSKKAPIMQRVNDIEPIIRDMIESGELRSIIEQFYLQRDLLIPKLW